VQQLHDLPGVSVAMATYNGACYLREQLASIAAQTLLPAELVVSDDGSSDDTLAIIRAFAEQVSFPVRILNKTERLGFSDNFLFAAEHCARPLIAFVDQDDKWLPDKLEQGVRRLMADDSLMSLHQLTMTDGDLVPTELWDQGIVADRVWQPLELDPWAGWGNTMVFRRELVTLVPRATRPRHPEAQRPLSHDTWLYIVAAAIGRVSHIAQPLILYRQHGGNACGMAKPTLRARWRTATTVPLESYRERVIFFDHLATLFDELARTGQGEPGARAAAAAVRYRERRDRFVLRARLHGGRTLMERSRAWVRLQSLRDGDQVAPRTWLLSAVKDAALGVTGWGHHI
jgi:hypothetical protein